MVPSITACPDPEAAKQPKTITIPLQWQLVCNRTHIFGVIPVGFFFFGKGEMSLCVLFGQHCLFLPFLIFCHFSFFFFDFHSAIFWSWSLTLATASEPYGSLDLVHSFFCALWVIDGCSWSYFGRPATAGKAHHCLMFLQFMDNGSYNLLESQSLRNDFVILSKRG